MTTTKAIGTQQQPKGILKTSNMLRADQLHFEDAEPSEQFSLTGMAIKPPVEEEKEVQAFTSEPASANAKLMDFEAQLLMKAGKSAANTKPTAAANKGEFYNPPSLA